VRGCVCGGRQSQGAIETDKDITRACMCGRVQKGGNERKRAREKKRVHEREKEIENERKRERESTRWRGCV